MSKEGWITVGTPTPSTLYQTRVVMDYSQVNALPAIMATPTFQSVLFGDPQQWISNLIWYPINVIHGESMYLTCGNTETSAECHPWWIQYDYGFTLHQYYHQMPLGSYLDYEPYTTIEAYLPYYGVITLPITEIANKYTQFRLFINFDTGAALYVVGVSDNPIGWYSGNPCRLVLTTNNPNEEYRTYYVNDENVRIIGQYNFQLGVIIPRGSENATEVVRNAIISTLKLGAGVALSASGMTTQPTQTTHTLSKTTTTTRNPSTGRQITQGTITTEQSQEKSVQSENPISKSVSSAVSAGISTIGNSQIRATIDTPQAGFLSNSLPHQIYIIKRKLNAVPVDENYRKTKGLPLGENRILGNLTGYTKISDVFVSGQGFESATHEELDLLSRELLNGVIL